MLKLYQIPNIEPFNEISYKSCAYNPLFTGVYYLGGHIFPFLANDFFTYKASSNEVFNLAMKNITVAKESELLKQMGIYIDTFYEKDNEIEEIKKAISNNIPVILIIDRFYWSDNTVNKGIYKARHLIHLVLAFGYNDITKELDIFHTTSTECARGKISYDELTQSYKTISEMSEKQILNIQKLCPLPERGLLDFNKNKYFEIYRENFKKTRDEILTGFEAIKNTIALYEKCAASPNLILNANIPSLSEPFDPIKKAKEIEMYRVYNFFHEPSELLSILKETLVSFSIIQGKLLKINLTQNFTQNSLSIILDKLDHIYKNERLYIDKISNLL